MNLLALTRYGRLGASSRLRFLQFVPWLGQAGVHCTVHTLVDDTMLAAKYRDGAYPKGQLVTAYGRRIANLLRRQRFDLLWIEKEALPWLPVWFELRLLRGARYVLDYDDAVFHNYDLHRWALVKSLFGRRIDCLMSRATLVVAGNDYLAQRAREAQAAWVEVLPTVVDVDRYSLLAHKPTGTRVPRLVWIGSPATWHYLLTLATPLAELARRADFVLRVIGAAVHLPGVKLESVAWTESTEVKSIADCDIGIMPLNDSLWEQGKCGYKLIQYMACGLPVVASPVGVNRKIVRHGENGFLAANAQAWIDHLAQLLADAHLREFMGQRGRQTVERDYSTYKLAPRLTALLQAAARDHDHSTPDAKP